VEPTIFKPRLKFKLPLKFFKFGHRAYTGFNIGGGGQNKHKPPSPRLNPGYATNSVS